LCWLVSLALDGNDRDEERHLVISGRMSPRVPRGVSGEVVELRPGGLLRVDHGSLGVVQGELPVQAAADPFRVLVRIDACMAVSTEPGGKALTATPLPVPSAS
jgi:hypothetical protein